MENQKVIEIIQAGLVWGNWNDEQKEAFIMAGEAVKKQIPQGTIKIQGELGHICPICRSYVNGEYCSTCGQRIINNIRRNL